MGALAAFSSIITVTEFIKGWKKTNSEFQVPYQLDVSMTQSSQKPQEPIELVELEDGGTRVQQDRGGPLRDGGTPCAGYRIHSI